jgi:predicted methyltransferase MtxX (methanogen marker protein 4)
MPSEILLIVHPFYEQKMRPDNKTPEFNKITKNEAMHYGKLIKETIRNGGNIIFVPTAKIKDPDLKKQQSRLYEFMKREVPKEKLTLLPANFGVGHFSLKPISEGKMLILKTAMKKARNAIKKMGIGNNVKVTATGQYKDQCVNTAMDRLEYLLKERGHKVQSTIARGTNNT